MADKTTEQLMRESTFRFCLNAAASDMDIDPGTLVRMLDNHGLTIVLSDEQNRARVHAQEALNLLQRPDEE